MPGPAQQSLPLGVNRIGGGAFEDFTVQEGIGRAKFPGTEWLPGGEFQSAGPGFPDIDERPEERGVISDNITDLISIPCVEKTCLKDGVPNMLLQDEIVALRFFRSKVRVSAEIRGIAERFDQGRFFDSASL